jgi:hypothetical protein
MTGDTRLEESQKRVLSPEKKKKLIIMAIGAIIYGAPLLYLLIVSDSLAHGYYAALIAAFWGIGVGSFWGLVRKCVSKSLFGIKMPNPMSDISRHGIAYLIGPKMIFFTLYIGVVCISASALFLVSPFIAIYQVLRED